MVMDTKKFIDDYNEFVAKRDKEASQTEQQATQLANSRNTWNAEQKQAFIEYAKKIEYDNLSTDIAFYEKYITNEVVETVEEPEVVETVEEPEVVETVEEPEVVEEVK